MNGSEASTTPPEPSQYNAKNDSPPEDFPQEIRDLLDPNESDIQSEIDSVDSEIEPFAEYKPRIEELLRSIGLVGFAIEEIQHGYQYQNCVYGLASSNDPSEHYVIRIPVLPDLNDDGKCEAIENDAVLLEYLADKLPVPGVRTYDSTKANFLQKPYSIQSRLSGVSLNQFVDLMAKVESVQFAAAGTFSAFSSRSDSASDATLTAAPAISFFDEGDKEFIQHPHIAYDRSGLDLKLLLVSHIEGWIQKENKREKSYSLRSLRFLLSMIDCLDREGAFKSRHCAVILHHWDLEPRNIMVSKTADRNWKITGIIDWDSALALPRPLARRAPDWIWDFNSEGFTGYLDNDHHPKPDSELSAENSALKEYFDLKASAMLDGYADDTYGNGRWLRRIWTFARSGVDSMWYIDLVKILETDWTARPKLAPSPTVSGAWPVKVLRWVLGTEVGLRRLL
ncbi:MAG: hypothetical protein Q9171_000705 [Xanthocarpia ochracea]